MSDTDFGLPALRVEADVPGLYPRSLRPDRDGAGQLLCPLTRCCVQSAATAAGRVRGLHRDVARQRLEARAHGHRSCR